MNNNNGSNNGFLNGFLIGLIVGAAIVFFLGTKKGKQFLKAISEEGLGNISDLAEMVDEGLEDEEFLEGPEIMPQSAKIKEKNGATNGSSKKSLRRFFRGVPKKS